MFDPFTLLGIGSAAVGGIGSIFGGGNEVEVPQWSDIDLQRELPDLYAQYQQNQSLLAELQKLYAARGSGPNSSEQYMMREAQGQLQNQIVNQGLAGSSIGFGLQADLQRRLMDQVMQRAMAERQALLGGIGQQNQQNMQTLGGLYEMAMKPRAMEYQAALEDDAARNQFFSGLFSGGLGMISGGMAGQQYADLSNKLANVNMSLGFGNQTGGPIAPYAGVPGGYQISGFQPNFSMGGGFP